MHAPNLSLIPVELLLRAYRGGVFPMADHRDDPEVYWVEPRERATRRAGLAADRSRRWAARARGSA